MSDAYPHTWIQNYSGERLFVSVAIHPAFGGRVTINPRHVIKIEPALENSARIYLIDGTNIVTDWSYEYTLQQVCGIIGG